MGEIFTQGVSPTFLNLKNQLATMYGASEVADLQTIDQQRVGIYINQAYRECYAPIDGKRPTWAKTHFGFTLAAPKDVTFSAGGTKGSVSVSVESDVLNPTTYKNYEGSFLKVGDNWHIISDVSGDGTPTVLALVEPLEGAASGGTIYHSAYRLDREVIDVDMVPEVIGKGPMYPISSPEVAARIRSIYTYDFLPGRSWGKLPSIRHNSEELEIDRPTFYFIDNSALTIPNTSSTDAGLQSMEELAVRPRFNVYPVPDADYSIRGTANILPHELTADGDMARLPGNVVWDIMFPIAMAKLALTDPRYNGDNREAVQRTAEEARQRLKTFTNVQKHRNIRMVRRPGY